MARVATASTGRRMAFGVTLVYAMAISAYTQFLLGVLGPLLTEDLGLSRTQLGSLTTAIFVLGGLGAPLVGPLVDQLGGRRVLVLIFLTGATSWAGMGVAPTYGWLLGAACLAGLVRAASNPVGNQLVRLHVPVGRQGLIMGISKSGAQMGAFVVGVTVPGAAALFGWRGVMFASVGLSVIGLFATFATIPRDESREEVRARAVEEDDHEADGRARTLLAWLGAHAALIGFGTGSVNAYLPLFAVERLEMTVGAAGVVVSVMALTGIVARIFWGRQADRFRSPQVPLVLIASAGAAAMGILAMSSNGSRVMLWMGAIGFSLSAGSWIAVGMLVLIREVPVADTGKVSGIVLGLFYGGFSVSPVLFGWIVDRTDSYALAWGTGSVAYAGATWVAWAWHRRSSRPSAEDAAAAGHAEGR